MSWSNWRLLTYPDDEVGFMEQLEAAARAGFRGIDFLFPYEYPAEQIAEQITIRYGGWIGCEYKPKAERRKGWDGARRMASKRRI